MDRYKVMKTDEELFDSDMNAFKDYNKVLKAYKKQTFFSRIKTISIVGVTLVVATSALFYFDWKPKEFQNTYEFESASGNQLNANEPTRYKTDLNYLDTIKIKSQVVELINSQQDETQKSIPKTISTSEFHFDKAFPGYSLDSVFQLFQKELNANAKKPISGTILVVMVIDDTGKVKDPKIISGLEASVDSTVLEYLLKLPDWSPALLNSVSSSSTVTLPIEISINPDK